MKFLGKHIILELYDCPADVLSDPILIKEIMNDAANVMEATIVESKFHHFSPLGVSGVVIIMESHLTIHTWPEYGYAAVDIFTCGEIFMDKGIEYLRQHLKSGRMEVKKMGRGALNKFVETPVSK